MDIAVWFVLLAVVALAAVVVVRRGAGKSKGRADALDTVASWPPEATRVLTGEELRAYRTLVRALPEHIVLAQVPLSRFLKVPRRHSYGEWLHRVGQINADLLVCDMASQVVGVVEIHSARDSERSKERHQRMARVLKKAGIRCIVWMEGAIPAPEAAREQLLPQKPGAAGAPAPVRAPTPGPAPAPAPMPEPAVDPTPGREPMPSTWFDEFDSGPTPLAGASSREPAQTRAR
jgi:hypothetical protein